MKTIKNLNTFAVGLPLVILITYPFFKEGSLLFALLSTIVTGFIQFCLGLKLIFEMPDDSKFQIYIVGVFAFFTLWFINNVIDYNDVLTYILFPIPLILAIYLSVLIYKKETL